MLTKEGNLAAIATIAPRAAGRGQALMVMFLAAEGRDRSLGQLTITDGSRPSSLGKSLIFHHKRGGKVPPAF